MRFIARAVVLALACCEIVRAAPTPTSPQRSGVKAIVDATIRPLMQRYGIPGMAVGVIADGQPQVYEYGVASRVSRAPIGAQSLFEIGSLSKTFTATLATYAGLRGALALGDSPSTYLPALRGGRLDRVTLIELGTHTAGGFPLQVPESITTQAQLLTYFRTWKPQFAPGTVRTYANPSIGLLGMVAAASLHGDFGTLLGAHVLTPLGLHDTFLTVPTQRAADYVQGYTEANAPIRLHPGMLAAETYGIRTTAADLTRFVAANMQLLPLDKALARAIAATHTGYFRVGPMTQDLIWEQYPESAPLAALLEGSSDRIGFDDTPVQRITPPRAPDTRTLLNKTGSTNGFAAYVVFAPHRRSGVVLLANRRYPIAARVTAAYRILSALPQTR